MNPLAAKLDEIVTRKAQLSRTRRKLAFGIVIVTTAAQLLAGLGVANSLTVGFLTFVTAYSFGGLYATYLCSHRAGSTVLTVERTASSTLRTFCTWLGFFSGLFSLAFAFGGSLDGIAWRMRPIYLVPMLTASAIWAIRRSFIAGQVPTFEVEATLRDLEIDRIRINGRLTHLGVLRIFSAPPLIAEEGKGDE